MRLGEGVEWGLHCCLLLAWMEDEAPVPASKLAEYHGLPAAYLTKQMQALARAGIVTSMRGPGGGYSLSRPTQEITLLEVVDAVEGGRAVLFECTEIRRQGVCAGVPDSCFSLPCSIAQAMHHAEDKWREALADQTIADIVGAVGLSAPGSETLSRVWFSDKQSR